MEAFCFSYNGVHYGGIETRTALRVEYWRCFEAFIPWSGFYQAIIYPRAPFFLFSEVPGCRVVPSSLHLPML
jgi:hypothetical protein